MSAARTAAAACCHVRLPIARYASDWLSWQPSQSVRPAFLPSFRLHGGPAAERGGVPRAVAGRGAGRRRRAAAVDGRGAALAARPIAEDHAAPRVHLALGGCGAAHASQPRARAGERCAAAWKAHRAFVHALPLTWTHAPQILTEMHELNFVRRVHSRASPSLQHSLSFFSTIYVLIIGTYAVTGIPSAGSDHLPRMWRRDVWAVFWAVRAPSAFLSPSRCVFQPLASRARSLCAVRLLSDRPDCRLFAVYFLRRERVRRRCRGAALLR